MDFDLETAKAIVKKHNLSEKTILVWKNRGKIPDKYADENYKISEKVDKKFIDHLYKIFSSKYLNKSNFISVNASRQSDIKRGTARVTEDEYMLIKKELIALKNKFLKVKEQRSFDGRIRELKLFLTDKLIHKYLFSDKNTEEKYNIEKIVTDRTNMGTPDEQLTEQLIFKIQRFFNEILI